MNMSKELASEWQDVVKWIDQKFITIEVPSDSDREQIATGCFDIAIDFQAGMYGLFELNSYALMFASQRPIFDALLRGLWIQYCASEKEIEAFKTGSGPRKLLKMTTAIEAAVGDELLPLESYRARLEGHLHDFTHTGYQHIARRHGNKILGPNYPDHELCQVINFATLIGLQAAARMAIVAKETDLAAATHAKMVEYGKRYVQLREANMHSVKNSSS